MGDHIQQICISYNMHCNYVAWCRAVTLIISCACVEELLFNMLSNLPYLRHRKIMMRLLIL